MVRERGVIPGSNIFYNTPSATARSSYFHVTMAGDFWCDGSYHTKRSSFYNFLLIWVDSGTGSARLGDREYVLSPSSVLLIDCTRPHEYFTEDGWHISWIHFDGLASRAIYELLVAQGGHVVPMGHDRVVPHYLNLILAAFSQSRQLPEVLVSSHVHRILSEVLLVAQSLASPSVGMIDRVQDAIAYIQANFSTRVSVKEVAAYVHVSPFHFSRVFKLRTGYAPYEYVTKVRIDHAKTLLRTSAMSVRDVGSATGFSSESNFVSAFRRVTDQTPGRFRRTPL